LQTSDIHLSPCHHQQLLPPPACACPQSAYKNSCQLLILTCGLPTTCRQHHPLLHCKYQLLPPSVHVLCQLSDAAAGLCPSPKHVRHF
jgi:hypothetical protein